MIQLRIADCGLQIALNPEFGNGGRFHFTILHSQFTILGGLAFASDGRFAYVAQVRPAGDIDPPPAGLAWLGAPMWRNWQTR
jgi:hypothetical protein